MKNVILKALASLGTTKRRPVGHLLPDVLLKVVLRKEHLSLKFFDRQQVGPVVVSSETAFINETLINLSLPFHI